MSEIAKLGIVVNFQDVKKAREAVKELADTGKQAETSAKSLQGAVKGIGDASNQASRGVKNLEGSLKSVNSLQASFVSVAATLGLASLGQQFVEVNSKFGDFNNSLRVVTGSVEKGKAAFQFVQDFAKQTPFSVEQLTKSFITLKGAGIEPTEKLLRTFGDAASVTTDKVAAFDAMVKLTSRSVGGGLQLEDLETLVTNGIPVFQIFKEELGLTRDKISDFGGSAEGAKKLVDALYKGLDKRFGGAMVGSLGSLSNAVSNAGDSWDQFLYKLGNVGLTEVTTSGFKTLGGTLDTLSNNMNTVAGVVGGTLAGAFAIATAAVTAFTVSLLANPATLVFTAIATSVGYAVKEFLDFRDELSEVAGRAVSLGETWDVVWKGIKSVFNVIVEEIVSTFQATFPNLIQSFHTAAEWSVWFGNEVIGVWESVRNAYNTVVDGISNRWNSLVDSIVEKANQIRAAINSVTGLFGATPAAPQPTVRDRGDNSPNTQTVSGSLARISLSARTAFNPQQGVQFKPTEKPAANGNTKPGNTKPGNTGAGDDKGGKGSKGGKSEAEKAIDEQKRLAEAYKDKIAAMREESDLGKLKLANAGLESSELEKVLMMHEMEAQARKAKIALTPAEIDGNRKLVEQIVNQKTEFERLNDLRSKSKSIIEDLKTAEEDRSEKLKEASDMLAQKYLNEEQYMRRLIDINEEYTQSKIDSAERIKQKEEEKLNSSKRFEDGVTRGFNQLKAESDDFAKQGEQLVTGSIDGMADAMAEFATTGKLSFGDLIKSMIKDMIKMALIRAALNLVGMFGGGAPGASLGAYGTLDGGFTTGTMNGTPTTINWAKPTASANGNVFQGGRVVPFAKGGVFDKPAAFPLADGRTGIAFEAGPEAIMPLSRGADGKLGVKASGTNNTATAPIIVNVEINYTAGSSASPDQAIKDGQMMGKMIEAKVVEVMDKYQRNANARGRMAG
ncbi:tape measure protein [Escherichia coli]|uniref:tape measure protein n=1 Tax=Escherichia coli TaxID=562 RepID=UPI000E2183CA|nr:tape measure protein [Escherichia coli]